MEIARPRVRKRIIVQEEEDVAEEVEEQEAVKVLIEALPSMTIVQSPEEEVEEEEEGVESSLSSVALIAQQLSMERREQQQLQEGEKTEEVISPLPNETQQSEQEFTLRKEGGILSLLGETTSAPITPLTTATTTTCSTGTQLDTLSLSPTTFETPIPSAPIASMYPILNPDLDIILGVSALSAWTTSPTTTSSTEREGEEVAILPPLIPTLAPLTTTTSEASTPPTSTSASELHSKPWSIHLEVGARFLEAMEKDLDDFIIEDTEVSKLVEESSVRVRDPTIRRTVSGPHFSNDEPIWNEFQQLLKGFYEEEQQLHKLSENLRKALEDNLPHLTTNETWKPQTQNINATQSCRDGVSLVKNIAFEVLVYDTAGEAKVHQSLEKLRELSNRDLAAQTYKTKLAELKVSTFLDELLNNPSNFFLSRQRGDVAFLMDGTIQPSQRHEIDLLLGCVDILFTFSRRPPPAPVPVGDSAPANSLAYSLSHLSTFSERLKEWSVKLTGIVLRCAELRDHRHLFGQLLLTPDCGSWAASLVQFPRILETSSVLPDWNEATVSHFVHSISALLRHYLYQKKKAPRVPQVPIPVSATPMTSILSSPPPPLQNPQPASPPPAVEREPELLLSEEDYIALFEQFPFDSFLSSILTSSWLAGEMCTLLIDLCCDALEKIQRSVTYSQFFKYLGKTIVNVFTRYVDFVQASRNEIQYDTEAIAREKVQLESMFLTIVFTFLSINDLRQFLSHLPYQLVPEATCWNAFMVIYQHTPQAMSNTRKRRSQSLAQYENTSKLLSEGSLKGWKAVIQGNPNWRTEFTTSLRSSSSPDFIFHALTTLVIAQPKSDLLLVVAYELFHVAFLERPLQREFMKIARGVISTLCTKNPGILSLMMELVHQYIGYMDGNQQYLFRGLPFELFHPTPADIEALTLWLKSDPSSPESALAQYLLLKLNWGELISPVLATSEQAQAQTRIPTTPPPQQKNSFSLFVDPRIHRRFTLMLVEVLDSHLPTSEEGKSGSWIMKRKQQQTDKSTFYQWCWKFLLSLRNFFRNGTPCLPPLDLLDPSAALVRKFSTSLIQSISTPLAASSTIISEISGLISYILLELTSFGRDYKEFSTQGVYLLNLIATSAANTSDPLHHSHGLATERLLFDLLPGIVLHWSTSYISLPPPPSTQQSVASFSITELLDFKTTVLTPLLTNFFGLSGQTGLSLSKILRVVNINLETSQSNVKAASELLLSEMVLHKEDEVSNDWYLFGLFWLKELFGLPSWYTNQNTRYLVDGVLRNLLLVTTRRADIQALLELEQEKSSKIQGTPPLLQVIVAKEKRTSGLFGMNAVTSESSATSFSVSADLDFLRFEGMILETRKGEIARNQITEAWLRSNRSKTIEQILTELNLAQHLENFTIYKWANSCLTEDPDYPLLPLFWQVFFHLFFVRWIPTHPGAGGYEVEFPGLLYLFHKKKAALRQQLTERLELLSKHHMGKISALLQQQEMKLNPREEHCLRLGHLYNAMSLWLREHPVALLSKLDSLPPTYEVARLISIFNENPLSMNKRDERSCIWFDLVDLRDLVSSFKARTEGFLKRIQFKCLREQDEKRKRTTSTSSSLSSAGSSNPFHTGVKRKVDSQCREAPPVIIQQPIVISHPMQSLERGIEEDLQLLLVEEKAFYDQSNYGMSLDSELINLLRQFIRNEPVISQSEMPCDPAKCRGPAAFVVQILQPRVVETVKQGIDNNRAVAFSMVNRKVTKVEVTVSALRILKSVRLLAYFVQQVVQQGNNDSRSTLTGLGSKLFYRFLQLPRRGWAPLQLLEEVVVSMLGHTVILPNAPTETIQILQTILSNPAQLRELLLPFFNPAYCPSIFVDLYQTVVDSTSGSSIAVYLPILQVFDFRTWLQQAFSVAPQSEQRSILLNPLMKLCNILRDKAASSSSSSDAKAEWELHLRNLLEVALYSFSNMYLEVVSLILEHSRNGEFPPLIWDEVFQRLPFHSLDSQAIHSIISWVSKFFWDFRRNEGASRSLFSVWASYSASFAKLALILSTSPCLRGEESNSPSSSLQACWKVLETLYEPWLVILPTSSHSNAFADELLPWQSGQTQLALEFLTVVVDQAIQLSANDPGKIIINSVWNFLVSKVIVLGMPNHLLTTLHLSISRIPFETLIVNELFMQQLCALSSSPLATEASIFYFLSEIVMKLSWSSIQSSDVLRKSMKFFVWMIYAHPQPLSPDFLKFIEEKLPHGAWHLISVGTYNELLADIGVMNTISNFGNSIIAAMGYPNTETVALDLRNRLELLLQLLLFFATNDVETTQSPEHLVSSYEKLNTFAQFLVNILLSSFEPKPLLQPFIFKLLSCIRVRSLIPSTATLDTSQTRIPLRSLICKIFSLFNSPATSESLQVLRVAQQFCTDVPYLSQEILSAFCETICSLDKLSIVAEIAIESYFLSGSSWAGILPALQVPELGEEEFLTHCVQKGSLLTIYCFGLQQLARCTRIEETENISNWFNRWIMSARFTPNKEYKILLLWVKAIEVLHAQLFRTRIRGKEEQLWALGQHIHHLGGDRLPVNPIAPTLPTGGGLLSGIFGGIGDMLKNVVATGDPSPFPYAFRFACRALSTFTLCHFDDQGNLSLQRPQLSRNNERLVTDFMSLRNRPEFQPFTPGFTSVNNFIRDRNVNLGKASELLGVIAQSAFPQNKMFQCLRG